MRHGYDEENTGALGKIRTCDTLVRSQVLYPLSYERVIYLPETTVYLYHIMTTMKRVLGVKK